MCYKKWKDLAAITGYGAWLYNESGAEVFWEVQCGRKFTAPISAPTIPQIFTETFIEAFERARMHKRSLEGKKVCVLVGRLGCEISYELLSLLTERYNFIDRLDQITAPTPVELASLLLERSIASVLEQESHFTVACLIQGNPQTNQIIGAVTFVLEKARNASHDNLLAMTLLASDPPSNDLHFFENTRYITFCNQSEMSVSALTEIRGKDTIFGLRCVVDCLSECEASSVEQHAFAPFLKAVLSTERGAFPLTQCKQMLPYGFRISGSVQPWFSASKGNQRCAAVVVELPAEGRTIFRLASRQKSCVATFASRSIDIYTFSADSALDLIAVLESWTYSQKLPDPFDLAALDSRPWRAAVVAGTISEFREGARKAVELIRKKPLVGFAINQRIFYSGDPSISNAGKVVIMFPGHGSQFINLNWDILLAFPKYRETLDAWNQTQQENGVHSIFEWAYPDPTSWTITERKVCYEKINSIDEGGQIGLVSSIAMHNLLHSLDVVPDCVIGYSNGENAALVASGIVSAHQQQTLFGLMNRLKAEVSSNREINEYPLGRMLAVTISDPNIIYRIEEKYPGKVFLAMDNCPRQKIVFAVAQLIDVATTEIQTNGGFVLKLPFDRPFHTPLFERITENIFRPLYQCLNFVKPVIPIYSTVIADKFPLDQAGIVNLACRQWDSRVLFHGSIEKLYADGVRTFIEAGPGCHLAGFVADTLRGRQHTACSVSGDKKSSPLRNLLGVLAMLFVNDRWKAQALYCHRGSIALGLRNSVKPDLQLNLSQKISAQRALGTLTDYTRRTDVFRCYNSLMAEFLDAQMRMTKQWTDRISLITRKIGQEIQHFSASEAIILNKISSEALRCDFIEQQQNVWSCELSVEKHAFLRDHAFGMRVSDLRPWLRPLSFIALAHSLEIAVTAATKSAGTVGRSVRLTRTRAWRWITAERNQVTLRVSVGRRPRTAQNADRWRVCLEQETQSDEMNKAFETEISFDEGEDLKLYTLGLLETSATRWSAADFYRYLIFHGDSYRSIETIEYCGKDGVQAKIFGPRQQPNWQSTFTPTMIVDALGQLFAYWLFEERGLRFFGAFPISIGELFISKSSQVNQIDKLTCRGVMTCDGSYAYGQFEVFAPDGRVVVSANNFRMQIFPFSRRYMGTLYWQRPETEFSSPLSSVHIAGILLRTIDIVDHPYLEQSDMWVRSLAFVTLGESERKAWLEMMAIPRRKLEWLLGRIAAKDAVREWFRRNLQLALFPADVEIVADANGMPRVVCPDAKAIPTISITHSGGVIIAACSDPDAPIGIDFESTRNRKKVAALDSAFTPEEHALLKGEEGLLRGWICKEAASKAAGTGLAGAPRRWQLSIAPAGEWAVDGPGGKFMTSTYRHDAGWLAIAKKCLP